jgi:transcriptional regulator with XRE-family HTH domain
MRSAEHERAAFSLRLRQSLHEAGWKKLSANRLVEAFNFQARNSSVAVYAVRKWMNGKSIPTQARIVLLANLLNVTSQWLRFGSGPERTPNARFDTQDSVMLEDLSRLSEAHKHMAREMVKILIGAGSN